MDEQMITRLEGSFNAVAARSEELVDRFYAMLFAENPGVRPLFPADMKDQKKKLLASLVFVVRNLRNPTKMRDALLEMGQRHAGYQAQPEHYPIVRDTLIGVMAEIAGDAWSTQLDRDWRAAINQVAEIMIEGQRQAADQSSITISQR